MRRDPIRAIVLSNRVRIAAARAIVRLLLLTAPPAMAAPRIAIDAEWFDFGERSAHETVEHAFVLRNEGTEDLVILRTASGCMCTVADLAQTRLAPGATAALNVRIPLVGRIGLYRSTLTVASNDPERSPLRIVLQGRVTQDIALQPARLYFERFSPDETQSKTARLKVGRDGEYSVTRVESLSPWFSAESEPTPARDAWLLHVQSTSSPPTGTVQGTIRVFTTHPKFPHVDFQVFANMPGPITWMPGELVIPRGQIHPETKLVIVRPGQVRRFAISQVEAPPPMTAAVTVEPGGGYRVTLGGVMPAPELQGRRIVIHTDATNQPRVEIPIRIGTPGAE